MSIDSKLPVSDELVFPAVDEGRVPIREISRATGVNTVTLRAWERRYGLLVPERTSKGHRLYSLADIERVKEIQRWLERGLAISKVKALLMGSATEQSQQSFDSNWVLLAQQMQNAINQFQRNSMTRLLDETLGLYPVEMIADYLLVPLIAQLQGDEAGMAARRAFFMQIALEVVCAAQARQRQAATGEKLVLLSAGAQENPLFAQLLSYSLLINQHSVEYLGYLTVTEASLACQALAAKALIVVGYDPVSAAELPLSVSSWQEKLSVPIVLVGDICAPCQTLEQDQIAQLSLCNNQQQAVGFINTLLKG